MGRVLAVDTGTRRVGLAITDPLRMISSPLQTIAFVSESSLARDIIRISRDMDVSLVVIGLPLSADGSEGEGCARARRICGRLLAEGLDCRLWDESWTSRDAADALRAAGARRKASRQGRDRVAAALILRDYLDSTAAADGRSRGREAGSAGREPGQTPGS